MSITSNLYFLENVFKLLDINSKSIWNKFGVYNIFYVDPGTCYYSGMDSICTWSVTDMLIVIYT